MCSDSEKVIYLRCPWTKQLTTKHGFTSSKQDRMGGAISFKRLSKRELVVDWLIDWLIMRIRLWSRRVTTVSLIKDVLAAKMLLIVGHVPLSVIHRRLSVYAVNTTTNTNKCSNKNTIVD